MKIERKKNILFIILILIFYSSFGFWKFSNALLLENKSVGADSGDSIGGMGNIFWMKEEYKKKGIQSLISDFISTPELGAGHYPPQKTSFFWNLNFFFFSKFFTPNDVYDVNGYISFILTAICMFLIARSLQINPFFSFVASLLITFLKNFEARCYGHLFGLLTLYIPLLLILSSVRLGQKPKLNRFIIYAILLGINFIQNEYYGYFGLIFSSTLVISYFIFQHRNVIFYHKNFYRNIFISFMILLSLMFFFYPSIILGKLINLDQDILSKRSLSHSFENFVYYSTTNLFKIFEPSIFKLKEIFPKNFFVSSNPENTFQIGIIAPFIILSIPITIKILIKVRSKLFYKSLGSLNKINNSLIIWFFPVLMMFLFSLSPKKFPFSLVPLTYKIAPMFRVSVRALFFVDIAIIILFVYIMNEAYNFFSRNILNSKYEYLKKLLLISIFTLLSFFALIDVNPLNKILSKYRVYNMPGKSLYVLLQNQPRGHLLELPMHSLKNNPPEKYYPYIYNRIYHKKPIINILIDKRYKEQIHVFTQKVNNPTEEYYNKLRKYGVVYIVANKKEFINHHLLKNFKSLILLKENKTHSIYKFKNPNYNFSKKNFFNNLIFNKKIF